MRSKCRWCSSWRCRAYRGRAVLAHHEGPVAGKGQQGLGRQVHPVGGRGSRGRPSLSQRRTRSSLSSTMSDTCGPAHTRKSLPLPQEPGPGSMRPATSVLARARVVTSTPACGNKVQHPFQPLRPLVPPMPEQLGVVGGNDQWIGPGARRSSRRRRRTTSTKSSASRSTARGCGSLVVGGLVRAVDGAGGDPAGAEAAHRPPRGSPGTRGDPGIPCAATTRGRSRPGRGRRRPRRCRRRSTRCAWPGRRAASSGRPSGNARRRRGRRAPPAPAGTRTRAPRCPAGRCRSGRCGRRVPSAG